MRKKNTYILIASLILVLMIILGVSYALLQKNIVGNSNKIIYQVGDLEVKLDDTGSKDIGITGAAPTEDSDGLKSEPYSFSLVNNAGTDLKYTIYLEDDADAKNKCGSDCELIPYNFIKYDLSSDSNSLKTGNLSSSSTELHTGTIESKTTDKFNLRVWLSIDADNSAMGKYYFGKLKVVLSQGDDYCIRNGFIKLSDCMLVMNSHESNVETAKQNIVAKGTPDFSKTATTAEGLFMAEDDDGPSYYYRGAVKNNYVSFAGFMWRIIRQNGDGSIRMIYAGKKTNDIGASTTIGLSRFSILYFDPTYVGYKYNDNFSLHENNAESNIQWFSDTDSYVFGTNYNFDETTKKFTLTGTKKNLTIKDNYDEIVNNKLYSCLSSDCNMLYMVLGRPTEHLLSVQIISYSSNSYSDTLLNNTDSLPKKKIDSWYENSIVKYKKYLSSTSFCNDRSLNSGDGFSVSNSTLYGPYYRLFMNRIPSLKCTQNSDTFSTLNETAKLEYPVGMLTADEVSMAGGVTGLSNTSYYLYNKFDNWTMSPSIFYHYGSGANIWSLLSDGKMNVGYFVYNNLGLRPVINLKQDVEIISGDGTSISPFKIKTS